MACKGLFGLLFGHRWRKRTKWTQCKKTKYYNHFAKCTRCGAVCNDYQLK